MDSRRRAIFIAIAVVVVIATVGLFLNNFRQYGQATSTGANGSTAVPSEQRP